MLGVYRPFCTIKIHDKIICIFVQTIKHSLLDYLSARWRFFDYITLSIISCYVILYNNYYTPRRYYTLSHRAGGVLRIVLATTSAITRFPPYWYPVRLFPREWTLPGLEKNTFPVPGWSAYFAVTIIIGSIVVQPVDDKQCKAEIIRFCNMIFAAGRHNNIIVSTARVYNIT